MSIDDPKDFEGMREVSHAVAETLRRMQAHAEVGMSTKELDEFGEKVLAEFGAKSAPYHQYKFPGCNCISVNHVAAHGVPSRELVMKEGDLVNVDVSAELNGYFGDNGGSFILGEDLQGLSPLVEASREILRLAIGEIRDGVRISHVGKLIEKEAEKRGFTTIKNLFGHGIGKKLHDAPYNLPNFHDIFNLSKFRKNHVIALETFISTGTRRVHEAEDGWTLEAIDGSFVAQHEHTLVITEGSPLILTKTNGVFPELNS